MPVLSKKYKLQLCYERHDLVNFYFSFRQIAALVPTRAPRPSPKAKMRIAAAPKDLRTPVNRA